MSGGCRPLARGFLAEGKHGGFPGPPSARHPNLQVRWCCRQGTELQFHQPTPPASCESLPSVCPGCNRDEICVQALVLEAEEKLEHSSERARSLAVYEVTIASVDQPKLLSRLSEALVSTLSTVSLCPTPCRPARWLQGFLLSSLQLDMEVGPAASPHSRSRCYTTSGKSLEGPQSCSQCPAGSAAHGGWVWTSATYQLHSQ